MTTTKLLDFPPEVFERVIAYYVTRVGPGKAWKHREVCKPFATYIEDEIIAKQPGKSFRRSNGSEQLLKLNIGKWLLYRTKSPHSEGEILPSLIRNTVQSLLNIIEARIPQEKEAVTEVVIEVLTKHCGNALSIITKPSPNAPARFAKDTVDENSLAVAGLGLEEDERIRTSVEIAARSGNLTMIELLVKNAKPSEDMRINNKYVDTLSRCINISLQDKTFDIATMIMAWMAQNLKTRPHKDNCELWFKTAFQNTLTRFMDALLNYRGFMRDSTRYDFYQLACDAGNTELVRIFLKKQCVRPELYPALHYAVSTNNHNIVRTALDAGCHPDGRKINAKNPINVQNPLWLAARRGEVRVVKLLLSRGAKAYIGGYACGHGYVAIERPFSQELEYLPKGTKTYELMAEAFGE